MASNQRIKLKRQTQVGAAAVGKKPTLASLEDGELAVNTVDGKLFLKKTDTSGVASIVEVGADPFPSQTNRAGKFLQTDGTSVTWALPSVVNSAQMDIAYSLAPASVMVGMVVYHNGTKYEAAIANDVTKADVIGVVTKIVPNVSVTITTNGFIDLTSLYPNQTGPWVAGNTYFLSATTAGVLTSVEPTGSGTISKPLMIAVSSAQGFFNNWRGIANDIPDSNINTLLPAQSAGTVGQVLTSGATGECYWANAGGGGSGASSVIDVDQVSHGFVIGDLVRYDGTVGMQRYVKSIASSADTSDVVGIVSSITNANRCTVTTGGVVTTLTGLTPGASYFLSATVAGAYTVVEPSAIGAISKPVLMALSTTSAIFYNWRGIGISVLSAAPEVASQVNNSGKFLTTNGVSTLWSAAVSSFNNRTGGVTLQSADVTTALGYTPYNGTTNPSNYVTTTTAVTSFNTRQGAVTLTSADITGVGGALLASPAFTGNPTAPTPASGDNDTSVATTAFVRTAINTYAVGSFNGRTGAVNLTSADITGVGGALLASPAFTGNPTAPTPAVSDNSTALATTSFVQSIAKANMQTLGTPGYVTLPGGLIMQWGNVLHNAASAQVTHSFGTPFPTTALVVFVSQDAEPNQPSVGASVVSRTQFKTYSTSNADGIFYLALGM